MSDFNAPESRNEAILQNMLGADNQLLPPQSRIEVLLQMLLEEWKGLDPSGGGGSSITESQLLTLSANGWDSNTKQQTVNIELDAAKRNVIDITIGEIEEWNSLGIYPISETSTGITFEADTIPDKALTFKVCSMEVN